MKNECQTQTGLDLPRESAPFFRDPKNNGQATWRGPFLARTRQTTSGVVGASYEVKETVEVRPTSRVLRVRTSTWPRVTPSGLGGAQTQTPQQGVYLRDSPHPSRHRVIDGPTTISTDSLLWATTTPGVKDFPVSVLDSTVGDIRT